MSTTSLRTSGAPAYATLDPLRFDNVRAAAADLVHGYDAEKEFERGLSALLRGLVAGAA